MDFKNAEKIVVFKSVEDVYKDIHSDAQVT